jgi:Zn-finger nucleic acid-binding protein
MPWYPKCVEEEHAGIRTKTEIAKRPDTLYRIPCPNCDREDRPEKFRIDKPLRAFYDFGVNGKGQRDTYLKLAKELNIPEHGRCLTCGTQLIPRCPKPSHPDLPFIYFHKESRDWQCGTHPELIFKYECFHCDYPITLEKGATETKCPRCKRRLKLNYFAPLTVKKLAEEASEKDSRCLVTRLIAEPKIPLNDPESNERFCSNIYGCEASRNYRDKPHLMLPDTKLCPVCNSEAMPPILARAREKQIIDKCPYCHEVWLYGHENEIETVMWKKGKETRDGDCPLCGRSPASDYEMLFGEESDENLFIRHVQIGRALTAPGSPTQAYDRLLKRVDWLEHESQEVIASTFASFLKAVKLEKPQYAVLKRQIAEMLRRHKDAFP